MPHLETPWPLLHLSHWILDLDFKQACLLHHSIFSLLHIYQFLQPPDCGFCSNNWYILKQRLRLQYGVKEYPAFRELKLVFTIFKVRKYSLWVRCMWYVSYCSILLLPISLSKVHNGFGYFLNEHSYFYATAY